jgi:RNA-directed DNA polymerase
MRLTPFLRGLIGAVVNTKPNLPRAGFDHLKVTFHNGIHRGSDSQGRLSHADFKAHLTGRISYTNGLNPAKGEQWLWRHIDWTDER